MQRIQQHETRLRLIPSFLPNHHVIEARIDDGRRLAAPRVVDAVDDQLLTHVLQQLVRVQQHRQTEVAATRRLDQQLLLLEERKEHAAPLEDCRALAPFPQLLFRLLVVDTT